MSELYRVTVQSKNVVADVTSLALDNPLDGEIFVALEKIRKKKLRGVDALRTADASSASEAFLAASTHLERLRTFGALLSHAPDHAEKIVLDLTVESRKTGRLASRLPGYLQRWLLATARGAPAREPLAALTLSIVQTDPSITAPASVMGQARAVFLAALVAMKGLDLSPNLALAQMGGFDALARPSVAPVMTKAEQDAYLAKVFALVLSWSDAAETGPRSADISFVSPAQLAEHLSEGETYLTTAWPIFGQYGYGR